MEHPITYEACAAVASNEIKRTEEDENCRYLSMDALDFLQQMLQKNPLERSTLEQLEAHPWLQQTTTTTASTPCKGDVNKVLSF
jgi:serine/threonine protein kinase